MDGNTRFCLVGNPSRSSIENDSVGYRRIAGAIKRTIADEGKNIYGKFGKYETVTGDSKEEDGEYL